MLARDTIDGPTADLTDYRALPPPVAAVRLPGVHAYQTVNDDDEAVLVVSDGETTVEFGCGLRGPNRSAIRGAKLLADAISEFAVAMKADVEGGGPA
jgi:hypothetical protein